MVLGSETVHPSIGEYYCCTAHTEQAIGDEHRTLIAEIPILHATSLHITSNVPYLLRQISIGLMIQGPSLCGG